MMLFRLSRRVDVEPFGGNCADCVAGPPLPLQQSFLFAVVAVALGQVPARNSGRIAAFQSVLSQDLRHGLPPTFGADRPEPPDRAQNAAGIPWKSKESSER